MCSLFRVGIFADVRRALLGQRWLAVWVVATLCIAASAPEAMAQGLPKLSFQSTTINVAHDATTATLQLNTTKVFSDTQSIEILLFIDSGRIGKSVEKLVELPANTKNQKFTVSISEFARKTDGSVVIEAKINPPNVDVPVFTTNNTKALIKVAARPEPVPTTPSVSIDEKAVNVAHGTPSVTLKLTTTEPFNQPKLIALTIDAGNRPNFKSFDVTLPKDATEIEFTLQKSYFATALESDGSLRLIVKIDDAELDGSFEIGNTETIINFAAPPAPAPVTATISLQETNVDVAQDAESVSLTLATTEAFDTAKSIRLAITAGAEPNSQLIAVVLPKDATEIEFTLQKSDFVTALEPDGSLRLIVKIDDAELDGSFEIGNSETIINFAAPSATAAPAAPPPAPIAPPAPAAPTLTLQTLSTGSTGTFQFAVQFGGSSRQVSITTTRANEIKGSTAFPVAGGTLVIAQSATTGFTFFDANCSLGTNNHARVINIDARTVSMQIPVTGNVVCTIINRGEEAHTKTVVSRFVKRRVQQLTSHIGQTRRSAGRFAGSRRTGGGVGLSGAGTETAGHLGMQASLSRLGASIEPDSPTAKAAKLGVDAAKYGVQQGPQYRSGWDIWTEGSWSYHTTDGRKSGGLASSGQFGVLRAGADYLVNSKLLLGVVAQYDYLSDSSKTKTADGYRIQGHGWLAGPYLEIGLTQNLFFDAKALWGTSKNEIAPNLSYTDEFTTQRWLASARLTGSWSWKHSERGAWTFSPRAEVVWFNESVTNYTSAQDVAISGDDVHLGRFNIGPEFSYRYTTASGIMIEPRIGAQALLSFSYSDTGAGAGGDGLDSATRTSAKDTPIDNFQMRFIGGLKIELPQGTRVELEGSYTGLGQQGYESVSGKLGLTIPLQ